jgi:hypothetical protein
MHATELLERQFAATNQIFHTVADDLTARESLMRVLPDTNLLAFDLWHVARTQDWALQTLVKGETEIIDCPDWRERLPGHGIGVGLSPSQADELAHKLALHDLIAYADTAHQAIITWLRATPDEGLSRAPDVLQHLARYPVYLGQAMRDEVPWMFEGPQVWRCLAPALGHVRDHLAEMDLVKCQMRAKQAPSRPNLRFWQQHRILAKTRQNETA